MGKIVLFQHFTPQEQKRCLGGTAVPFSSTTGLRLVRVSKRELWAGLGRKGRRTNIHDLLVLFFTPVNPDNSVFTPISG